MQEQREHTQDRGAHSRGDQRVLSSRQPLEDVLLIPSGGVGDQRRGQVYLVAVVERAAEPRGDLPERGDVLSGLSPVDEPSGLGVTDADDQRGRTDAGMRGMPVVGTVSPSLISMIVVLRGFHGLAMRAASTKPSSSVVRPDGNA